MVRPTLDPYLSPVEADNANHGGRRPGAGRPRGRRNGPRKPASWGAARLRQAARAFFRENSARTPADLLEALTPKITEFLLCSGDPAIVLRVWAALREDAKPAKPAEPDPWAEIAGKYANGDEDV